MIILIGPSASGKTEIAKALIEKFNFKKFVTTTTRLPRINEVNNVDYHFISIDEFKKKIEENAFIEYVNYNGNYYGTTYEEINDFKVLILEPKGLKKFKSLKNQKIVSFYIDASKATRKERMIERKDDLKEINERIAKDDSYFAPAKKDVDYIIDNDNNSTSILNIANKIYNLYESKIN